MSAIDDLDNSLFGFSKKSKDSKPITTALKPVESVTNEKPANEKPTEKSAEKKVEDLDIDDDLLNSMGFSNTRKSSKKEVPQTEAINTNSANNSSDLPSYFLPGRNRRRTSEKGNDISTSNDALLKIESAVPENTESKQTKIQTEKYEKLESETTKEHEETKKPNDKVKDLKVYSELKKSEKSRKPNYSALSEKERMDLWCKWLNLGQIEDQEYLYFASIGAKSKLPPLWIEKDGGFYHEREGVFASEHPLVQKLKEELYQKKTAILSELSVTSNDFISELDDEEYQEEYNETQDKRHENQRHEMSKTYSEVHNEQNDVVTIKEVKKPEKKAEVKSNSTLQLSTYSNPTLDLKSELDFAIGNNRLQIHQFELIHQQLNDKDKQVKVLESSLESLKAKHSGLEQQLKAEFDKRLQQELQAQKNVLLVQHLEEINNLKDSHKKEINDLKSRIDSEIGIAKNAKESSNQLIGITEKLQKSSKVFNSLQGKFNDTYAGFMKDYEEKVKSQEEALKVANTRLKEEQDNLVKERLQMQDFLKTMEESLKESKLREDEIHRQLQSERKQMDSKVQEMKMEREVLFQRMNADRAELQKEKERFLQERSDFTSQTSNERKQIVHERAILSADLIKFRNDESDLIHRIQEMEAKYSAERRSIETEKAHLEVQRAAVDKMQAAVTLERNKIDTEWAMIKMESKKLESDRLSFQATYQEALELKSQAQKEKREAEALFHKKKEVEEELIEIRQELKDKERELRKLHQSIETERFNLIKESRNFNAMKSEVQEEAADEELVKFQKMLAVQNIKAISSADKYLHSPIKNLNTKAFVHPPPLRHLLNQRHLKLAQSYLQDNDLERQEDFLRMNRIK